ncbi:UDP-N-acetylmuramoyl-tripeptide--D-alanyl-D-alanine ligase [Pantoea sp. WMus005]|uniref:UDP-N-acetylmuramoyl-tripeptide--D-alanyl-D- alanine ligase n=1 Tax=Pantoea sp. WMus005 TaxID=2750734 RepID=UPI0015CF89A8|nr:UDP-N-acetylmuramoyl-tripeptide--D-alanyl-D-alanine ligase [Pantoea sp. WMus005]NYS30544.1 UDP-N-acetylmuramoyl-tripeptide--D-alanyl-D-alanine ligase [Pantoea sp. WMus005]
MIPVSLKTLAEITGGMLHGSDLTLSDVTTDTRKVTAGSLFVALVGERFDAHDFAEDAIARGAQALLVSKHLPVAVPQVVVEDTRIAFGRLGGWVRQQSTARVVALTGSSGKTSVKEMTAAILRQCGETLYTAGNLNNDYGVPMTLLRLTTEHQYAVIELGANHQGEIAYTTDLVKPESALVNNLAAAHLEGFGSLAGVAKAKGEIFQGLPANGIAILNEESNDWPNWQTTLQDKTVWRFSPQAEECDFTARDIRIAQDGTHFVMKTPRGEAEIVLPLPGRHNIANALAAAALALSVDAPLSAVQQGLKDLQSVPGRLFPVRLSAHQLLLDDSYNANVGSMTAAVQVLSEMPGYQVLVAGDMAELGDETERCHREIGEAAREAGIDCVLSCGKFSHLISESSEVGEHFSDKTALTERLRQLLSEHSEITVLIKGSRSAAMEQVVLSLKEKGTC